MLAARIFTFVLVLIVITGAMAPTVSFPADGALEQGQPSQPVPIQTVTAQPADPQPFTLELTPYRPRDVADEDSRPMPLPARDHSQPRPDHSRSLREMITFDVRTRTETRQPSSRDGNGEMRQTVGGFGGAVEQELSEPLGKDFSGMSFVNNPNSGNFPKQVKLFIDFTDVNSMQRTFVCSGTMISPVHVVTAGHCIFAFDDGDGTAINAWADEVRVYAGYNNGEGPMGTATSIAMRSWSGWVQNEDPDHDVALVTFDRPIGALSGWRGIGTTSDFDWYDSGSWAHFTYPAVAPFDGTSMYQDSGNYDYDDDELIGFDRPGVGGTSGGGAIRDNAVWAVRSHTTTNTWGDADAYDTRITHPKFDDILQSLTDDHPDSPDLVPLDVEVGTSNATAGTTIPGVSFLAHNHSDASFNSTIFYTIYLSTDRTVTTADNGVTSGSVLVSLNPNGSVRINVPDPIIPPQTQANDYWLGIVITNNDSNTSNNGMADADVEYLNVSCQTQGEVPIPAFPVDGHPCVPTTVSLNWGPVSFPGADYEVQVGRIPGSGNIYSTSSTLYTVSGLLENTQYAWRVRALTECGAYSPWSNIFFFWTEGNLDVISLLSPAPDAGCQPTSVTLDWDDVPRAASYRVRFSEVGGTAQVYDVTAPTTSLVMNGLLPGKRYEWRVKAKNQCGFFGAYRRSFFYTAETTPPVATLVSPVQDAYTLADVTLETAGTFNAVQWEYELETATGNPVVSTSGGFQLDVAGLAEDDYRWRARMESCTSSGNAWGPWSAWETFTVDLTPPSFASAPTSPSHTIGVWTNQTLLNVDWLPATDNCCVAEYWVMFDQAPDTTPDGTMSTTTAGSWEFEMSEGQTWFHLMALDSVGNASEVQHLGPFAVDLGPPTDPVLTSVVPAGDWVNTNELTVSWDAVTDPGAGVAGYSTAWSNSPSYVLDDTVDTTALSSTLTPVNEGWNYLYVRSVDVLGNAGPQQSYQIGVDRTDPVVDLWSPNGGEVYQTGFTVMIDFTANDNVAGPQWMKYEHSYSVDGGSFWYDIRFCFNPPNCGGGGGGQGGGPGTPGNSNWKVPWVPPGSPVLYRIVAIDLAGNRGENTSDAPFWINVTTGVDDLASINNYRLQGNAPNPFNPRTTIRYELPRETQVNLDVYDLSGRRVRTLVSELQSGPARHEAIWNGVDDQGQSVASGVYVYRLRAGDFVESRRMTLVK